MPAKHSELALLMIASLLLPLLFLSAPQLCRAESGHFEGLAIEEDGACATSQLDQSCPAGKPCVCFIGTGQVSGSAGSGYAEVDLNQDQSAQECAPFNASMFVVASVDVQELDFTGTWCKSKLNKIVGAYQITRSSKGLKSTGTIIGRYNSGSKRLTLHFEDSE